MNSYNIRHWLQFTFYTLYIYHNYIHAYIANSFVLFCSVTIALERNSVAVFKGFMIQARRSEFDAQPLGTFILVNDGKQQVMTCQSAGVSDRN